MTATSDNQSGRTEPRPENMSQAGATVCATLLVAAMRCRSDLDLERLQKSSEPLLLSPVPGDRVDPLGGIERLERRAPT